MSAVIFQGTSVKALKDKLKFFTSGSIESGTVDPTSSAVGADKGSLYINTSNGNVYRKLDSGSSTNWSILGSGTSGRNYVTNPDAEANTTGWNLFDDGAVSRPVNGTGGSAAQVTWTRSTSSALRGIGSFLYSKAAADGQGEGVSIDLVVDRADLGGVLEITGETELVSGTYVNGSASVDSDVIVYVYDVTNAVLIEPSAFKLQLNAVGTPGSFRCEFQTVTSSSSYRLILMSATTSAAAYVIKLDDITVGPVKRAYGSPVTGWLTESTTWRGSVTDPVKGTTSIDVLSYRRVGDSLEFHVEYQQTGAGTAGSGDYTIELPNGLQIDPDKLQYSASYQLAYVGIASLRITGNHSVGASIALTANGIGLIFESATGNFASPVPFGAGNALIDFDQATATISFHGVVPIIGWESSVEISNQTDTRVVASEYSSSTTSIDTTTPVVVFPTKSFDTHSGMDSGTGIYTVKVSGKYQVEATVRHSSAAIGGGGIQELYVQKNSDATIAIDRTAWSSSTFVIMLSGHAVLDCVAGDTIKVLAYNNTITSLDGSNQNNVCISRISGPSQIAASESITARASKSNTQSIPDATQTKVEWNVTDYDSHSGLDLVTNYRYTVQSAGKYSVNSIVEVDTSGTGQRALTLYKNGSAYAELGQQPVASAVTTTRVGGLTELNLVSGDYLEVFIFQNSTGALNIGVNGSVFSHLSISKVS